MLDRLARLARRAASVRFLALAGAAFFGLVTGIMVLSGGDGRYLIPGIVGLLWSLSTYAFVATFRFVPDRASPGDGIFARLKRRLLRGWFWLLALVCAGTTLAVVVLSFRLVSAWLRERPT